MLDRNEYIVRYMGVGRKIFDHCRVWDADREELLYFNIHEIPIEYRRMIRTTPIGLEDDEKTQIYQGDVLKIIFETPKHDVVMRGAVRTKGSYCCGLDLIKEDGTIDEEDGFYIDEPYIKSKILVGNVFEGWTWD